MYNIHRAREIILKALYSWELNNITDISDIVSMENTLQDIDLNLVSNVFLKVIFYHKEIDNLIVFYTDNWEISRINKVDLTILRMSIFFLKFQEEPRIPHEIIIDEAILLAKKFSGEFSYKFINGLLDSIYNGVTYSNK